MGRHCLDVVIYFSEQYASRAALLGRSLKPFLNGGKIHSMVTDELATEVALGEGFNVYQMAEIVQSRTFSDWDKKTFSEKLFTLGPTFTSQVLQTLPEGRRVLYLNSDIFFLRDPHGIWAGAEEWDVYLFPHHYSSINKMRLGKFGNLNAGAMAITKSKESLRVIERWADECASWCFDRAEQGKYADQKYLESFQLWSSKVSLATEKTMNLASWVSKAQNDDFQNCIFYHFHGLVGEGQSVFLPHIQYFRLAKRPEKKLHLDYLTALFKVEKELGVKASFRPRNSLSRPFKYRILILLSKIAGQVIRLPFSSPN